MIALIRTKWELIIYVVHICPSNYDMFKLTGKYLANLFTCGFSPGLRTQLVQWQNSDYLLFPHQVHQPKSVGAKLSKPSSLKYNRKIMTIYFFHIIYINLKVWRQNYENFPS